MVRARHIAVSICAVLILLAASACAPNPANHSTAGVALVEEGNVKLPAGEKLVLKYSQSCGKTICPHYWRFDYDGAGILTVTDTQSFEDRTRTFNLAAGAQSEIETYWLASPLHATANSDGSAQISYPAGFWSLWSFQSYDPPQ